MKNTDKIHPIVEHPHTYKLVYFSWSINPENFDQSYIDMHLRKSQELRKLRFIQPVEITIEYGFNGNTSGLEILDIKNRQLDSVRVEVRNSEQDPGISFKALEVIELK